MKQENQRTVAEQITDQYAVRLLRWAVRKTGNRQDGEDLAQEVLLQVFRSLAGGTEIRQPEHFVWKVAHYCWCNYLRKTKSVNELLPLDDSIPARTNPIESLIEDDSLQSEISRMRRQIADLSTNRRQAMILYYLDGLSVRQVAHRLGTTESSVKKFLFEARKKVKRKMEVRKTDTDYIYRPGKLVLGVSGILPDEPDTDKVNDNLVRQNILLLCAREPKRPDELAELTGIPKPYLEPELEWLTEREFLSLEGKKYATIIPIISKTHSQMRGDLYVNGAGRNPVDMVLNGLKEREQEIRDTGFFGADREFGVLLWPLLMLFISYFSRNSSLAVRLKHWDQRDIRPDGGSYYVIGNDMSEPQNLDPDGYFKPEGWTDFYGIVSDSCAGDNEEDSYYWLGLYTFKDEDYHPDIVSEENLQVKRAWHSLYCKLIEPGFGIDRLSEDEQEMLATAVSKGYADNDGGRYKPRFCILSREQYDTLKSSIFQPLLAAIEPELAGLAKLFSGIHTKNLPKITRGYADFLTYLDLWQFGFYAYIVAAEEGLLALPETPDEGAPLPLVLIS